MFSALLVATGLQGVLGTCAVGVFTLPANKLHTSYNVEYRAGHGLPYNAQSEGYVQFTNPIASWAVIHNNHSHCSTNMNGANGLVTQCHCSVLAGCNELVDPFDTLIQVNFTKPTTEIYNVCCPAPSCDAPKAEELTRQPNSKPRDVLETDSATCDIPVSANPGQAGVIQPSQNDMWAVAYGGYAGGSLNWGRSCSSYITWQNPPTSFDIIRNDHSHCSPSIAGNSLTVKCGCSVVVGCGPLSDPFDTQIWVHFNGTSGNITASQACA
jgi:hypothetical protein